MSFDAFKRKYLQLPEGKLRVTLIKWKVNIGI
jgi:hypothetical protein